MTDACSSISRRDQRQVSESETSSTPTAEEREAAKIDREKAAEKEAEARRNAYFASGTDEGGRSSRAASDARSHDPSSHDDPKLKESRRTAAIDPPLQDDVVGNAIVAAAASGLAGGLRAVAVQRPGAAAAVAATKTAKSLASKAVLSTTNTGPEVAPQSPSKPLASSPSDAGRTGPKGTSEVAPAPNRSEPPPAVLGPVVVRG